MRRLLLIGATLGASSALLGGCSLVYDGSSHTVGGLGCQDHADCDSVLGGAHRDEGWICVDRVCQEACTDDEQCAPPGATPHPWGHRCLNIPSFVRKCGCSTAADCNEGEGCILDPEDGIGVCLAADCTDHMQCTPPDLCRENICQAPASCTRPEDCEEGLQCFDPGPMGMCIPRCMNDMMCPMPATCLTDTGICQLPDA